MLGSLKKINFLINKRQRKGLIVLTILLFIGMFFEIFGLGILIPTISIISDPNLLETYPLISPIRIFFNDFSDNEFILIFLVFVIVLYFLKSLFIVLLVFKQNRFISNISANISSELFSKYINQPYSFHLKQNSSELIKNIQVEVHHFNAFLLSLITLFIEGGFAIAVLGTLIFVEPLGAISLGIFYGILSLIFLRLTKRKIDEWGRLRLKVDTKAFKIATEALGGIKELIVFNKKQLFIDLFRENIFFKARLSSNYETISQIPRFYFELVSLIGLISFMIFFLIKGEDFATMISTLGLFVAATFRIIPSLNRMITSNQILKFTIFSINVIHKELKLESVNDTNSIQDFNFQNVIELKNIIFKYDKSNHVLNKVSLKINKGDTVGIIGESGSGKSTLVDLLMGLIEPSSGEILVDGIKNFQLTKSWKNKIGYVSQSIYLMDDSIKNNIGFGISGKLIDETRVINLLRQVRLDNFIKTLDKGINTKVGERGVQLSGGQRQRIGIARALYHDPDIIILDEATSALDLETERDIMDTFRGLKGKRTIIMIAHRISTLKDSDFLFKVEKGEIQKLKTIL